MSKRKTKYKLRFFKEQHSDSYEREVEERDVFILYSTCKRYFLSERGKNKKRERYYNLTMIYDSATFIVLLEVTAPILVRLLGKYFDKCKTKK
jgi:hypothetical protein